MRCIPIRASSSRSRIHGEKCIVALRPLRPILLSISKCLFKFYGPYLSQLSMMFSGLWPRNIPYWSEGREFSRLRATWNKDKFGDLQERRASLWHLRGHFHDLSDSRRRSAEEACDEEGISLLRGSPNEKARTWIWFANRKRPLRYLPFFSSFLFLSPWLCARNPKIRVYSFSFLVSHAYLEINEDNEIIYT